VRPRNPLRHVLRVLSKYLRWLAELLDEMRRVTPSRDPHQRVDNVLHASLPHRPTGEEHVPLEIIERPPAAHCFEQMPPARLALVDSV
jgi:hypothetical protein